MKDAIGHPVEIGDYVTAVFYSSEVTLFKVSDVVFHKRERCVKLERLKGTKAGEFEYSSKLIYKSSNQITWVDPQTVTMFYLLKN